MGRILSIDYGSKRVGIAVTDPAQIIATSLTTVHSKDVIQYIIDYASKETLECIVVGDPKQLNNMPSESKHLVDTFVRQLKKKLPHIPVELIDERFTSKIAQQTITMSGLKKKDRKNKKLIDSISATLILQSYLEKKKFIFG